MSGFSFHPKTSNTEPKEYTLLKKVPLFVSALTADNEAQFQKIVKENIVSWMVSFRAEDDLATGYMPGNKFSQKSTRGAFVAALKKAVGQYQSGDGIATGSWQLPCGMPAADVVTYVMAQYDENGVRMDAVPSTPVEKWDGHIVKKLHVQHEPKPQWVCRLGKKRKKPQAQKLTLHEVQKLSVAFYGRPVHKRACPQAKAERAAQVLIQTEQDQARRDACVSQKEITARRRAAQKPYELTPRQKARRAELQAEALAAAQNRGDAISVDFSIEERLDRGFGKGIVRKARKRDAKGDLVVDSRGRPVWEPQLLLIASETLETSTADQSTVETQVVDTAEVKAALLESRAPVPAPWKRKPEPGNTKTKGPERTEAIADGRVRRKCAQAGDAEMASLETSSEHAMCYQDTEARRQARGQEWYQQWCQENAEMLAQFGIAA